MAENRAAFALGAKDMDRQKIFAWAKQQYGTEPDYPWKDNNAVLRHRDNHKWYAVLLEVSSTRLGLPGEETVDVLNVKCEPLLIGSLRTQPGFFPAYHMNKDKWLSILLDGTVPEEEVKSLMDMSYGLTCPKKRKPSERVNGGK